MRHKTLFRLMLKVIGVWIFASGAHSSITPLAYVVYQVGQIGNLTLTGRDWYSIMNLLDLLYAAFGVYLFFGGEWIVDKAIPSNRPYCHECGYDLTGAKRNRCPECDTPFRPEDVMPKEDDVADESTILSGERQDPE